MSELFSIQLQNRQQQGRDGVWLDLPTTTEQVQAALRQIGISSDNPQGLFISGYFAEEEKRFAIPYNMVLASNVDELNFLAARLETLSAGERAELNAALQAPQSELSSIGRITDFPENVDYYVHLPDVRGPAQLGDYYLNRSGMVNMPEEWKGGIDTAQFGRYVAQQEQGAFTQYGYLVKSGDAWQKVHEGQPVPEEYRVLSFPAPEVMRDAANIPPPVQPETEPQKVIPIILNGKDSAERMKEITDRLETGIQAVVRQRPLQSLPHHDGEIPQLQLQQHLADRHAGRTAGGGLQQVERHVPPHRKERRKRHQNPCSCAVQGQAEDGKAGRTGQADSGQGRQAADGRKNGADSGVQGGVCVRCQPDRGRTAALYCSE